MVDFFYLRDADFVGDGVSLDDADGVAEELKSILGHRLRYRYRIARAVCIGRAGDVYAVVVLLINI